MSYKTNFSVLHPRHLYYTPDSVRYVLNRPDVDRFGWQVKKYESATEKTVICTDPEQGRVLFQSILPTNLREAMLMGFIAGKSAGYFEDSRMMHYVMADDPLYARLGYGAYDPQDPPITEAEDNFQNQFTVVPEPYWPEDDENAMAQAAE